MKSILLWLKDYFDLNYSERRGIMLLLLLIFLLVVFRYAIPYLLPAQADEYDFTEIKLLAKELESNQKTAVNGHYSTDDLSFTELEKDAEKSVQLFSFDPNTASLEDFRKLGLSAKLSKTIINYRNKGGKFFKKEDLQKIYGLRPEQYQKLEPFINLSSKADKYKTEFGRSGTYINEKSEKTALVIEINSADSTDLVKLRGIGPAFSSRILKYRNLLGGFTRKEQLLEVYGLDSVKYNEIQNYLTINSQQIRKININTASVEDLRKHPYLKYKLANAIVQYRQRNGNYKTIDELKKIYILDQKTFEKIRPYIVVD